jgi:CheY-like chemotaxis protein
VSKRVLVVDDERCIADTLAAILRNAGYEAAVAYDGESALQRCQSVQPHLVITDVVMPGMNGIDMAMRIRQRFPDCKILLFSGVAGSADLLEDARRQGYDFEMLGKPIHPADLLAQVTARAPFPASVPATSDKPAPRLRRERKAG